MDSTLPSTPTDVEAWLASEYNTLQTAWRCGVYSYGSSTTYMICEPLFVALLDNTRYAMTMAEYAVYQSDQLGSWTAYQGEPFIEGTYTINLIGDSND